MKNKNREETCWQIKNSSTKYTKEDDHKKERVYLSSPTPERFQT